MSFRHSETSALAMLTKIEDFASQHRFETKAGLVLMSFLIGDCDHMGTPCELCGFDKDDIDIDDEEES